MTWGFKKWALLSPLLLLLTGCWSAVGINNRAMVSALAIDPGDKHTYKVTAQIIAPQGAASDQSGGGSGSATGSDKVVTATGEGDTLLEALVPVRSQLAKDLYLPVLRVVILNPKLSPEALNQTVIQMMRVPTIAPTVLMVVAEGSDAAKVLNAKPLTTPSSMADIHAAFTGVRRQDTMRVQLWQHFSSVMSPYSSLFLPTASISGGKLKLRGFALLHDGKVTGFVNDAADVHVFSMLAGRLHSGYYSIRDARGRTWGIRVTHTSVKTRYMTTPAPHFAIDVRMSAMLTASPPGPLGQSDLAGLSQLVAERFTTQGTRLLSVLQKQGVDPFNLMQTYVYTEHVVPTRPELEKIYRNTPITLHIGISTVAKGVVA